MAVSHAPPLLRFVFVLERSIFQKYIYYVDFLFSIFFRFLKKIEKSKDFCRYYKNF